MKKLGNERAKRISEVTPLSGKPVLFSFHHTVSSTAAQSLPTLFTPCHTQRPMPWQDAGQGCLWLGTTPPGSRRPSGSRGTQNLTKTPWRMFKKSVHQFTGDLPWWFPHFQNWGHFKNSDSQASSKTYWLNCFRSQVTENTHPNRLNRTFRGGWVVTLVKSGPPMSFSTILSPSRRRFPPLFGRGRDIPTH